MSKATLYFDDLNEDFEVKTGRRTIQWEDIQLFGRLTGDDHPLHMDQEYAATTPYGAPIAHGALVLSIAIGLVYEATQQVNVLEAFTQLRWRFNAPVMIGDSVWVQLRYHSKRSMPGYHGGLATFDVTIRNQRDEIVQQGQWTALLRSRPQDA